MTVLNINHTSYHKLLHDFAARFNIAHNPAYDFIYIQPPAGNGMMKAISLFNELEVLLADIIINSSITTIRERSANHYFILHFDDVFIADTAMIKVDDEMLHKTNIRHSVARLTSNIFENTEVLPAHMHIKSVKVLFSEEWLKKYMRLDAEDDVLKKYLSLKTESCDMEPLDGEYLKLMDDLWAADKDDPLQNIYLQNRVTLLIERFFTRLYEKSNVLKGKFNLSSDAINRLMQMEKILVEDFSKLPPTIEQFSKMILMSSTMLKKNFKTMYGDSIYAYYQKQRLQKANEMLISGQYSVRETAGAVGYNNVSNFTSAYKKQFKKPPGEALLQ
jgi:AraC-like DNA-binding protein